MDLAVLNDQFLLARMVENHSSLIWTERYSSAGDFSRESFDIGGTLSMLPLWTIDTVTGLQKPTVVSLRGSKVPMIVETHKIEKSTKGAPKITTTGRSFETVLDRRTTIKTPLGGGVPVSSWTSSQKTAVDAAYDVMNQVVTLGSANINDKIPEITIKTPIRPVGYAPPASDSSYQVDPGELYSWVLQQITSEKYGLRSVRPTQPDTTIAVEIYNGVDRTEDIVFDARFEEFDSSAYLLSQASWKNVDQVNAAHDSLEVTDGTSPTGLNRRTTYLDASSTATGVADATLTQIMQNLGTVDLANKLETALFSGEVSRQLGSRYGVDYFLGDTVKLSGDYGLSQFVQIAEFIRSEDSSGESAYPTFASNG